MLTVICVELMEAPGAVNWNTEGPSAQFKVETCVLSAEPVRKFVPVTVIGSAVPMTAQAGETAETVGTGLLGLLMMKLMGLERPFWPVPEAGLRVFTVTTPGLAINEVEMVAVTEMTLLLESSVTTVLHGPVPVVGHVLPFHCTFVVATKPAPFMVKVKAGLPAAISEGEIELKAAPVLF
jgi:hypothetical protein